MGSRDPAVGGSPPARPPTPHIGAPGYTAALMSLGFFAPGLIKGTACYFCLGVVSLLIQRIFFVKETPRCTRQESRQLGTIVVVLSVIIMWLFWAFVYMHQMVPLIYPFKMKPTLANVGG